MLNIGNSDVCRDFELFQVKIPLNFLGTLGFSIRREVTNGLRIISFALSFRAITVTADVKLSYSSTQVL